MATGNIKIDLRNVDAVAERLAMAMAIIQGLLDDQPEPGIRDKAEAFVDDMAQWLGMQVPE